MNKDQVIAGGVVIFTLGLSLVIYALSSYSSPQDIYDQTFLIYTVLGVLGVILTLSGMVLAVFFGSKKK